MAWYAELRRRRWYCIVGIDAIQVFKRKLYDEWWDSLTTAERAKVLEYRKAESERRKKEANQALQHLMLMNAAILDTYTRRF